MEETCCELASALSLAHGQETQRRRSLCANTPGVASQSNTWVACRVGLTSAQPSNMQCHQNSNLHKQATGAATDELCLDFTAPPLNQLAEAVEAVRTGQSCIESVGPFKFRHLVWSVAEASWSTAVAIVSAFHIDQVSLARRVRVSLVDPSGSTHAIAQGSTRGSLHQYSTGRSERIPVSSCDVVQRRLEGHSWLPGSGRCYSARLWAALGRPDEGDDLCRAQVLRREREHAQQQPNGQTTAGCGSFADASDSH